MENVPRVAEAAEFDTMIERLEEAGYKWSAMIANAAQYGSCQLACRFRARVSGKSRIMSSEKYSSSWWTKRGAVYFIGAGQPVVAIKIDVTQRDKIKQRLRAIQCDNHEPVELLGVIIFDAGPKPLLDAERREQALHAQFARHRQLSDGLLALVSLFPRFGDALILNGRRAALEYYCGMCV